MNESYRLKEPNSSSFHSISSLAASLSLLMFFPDAQAQTNNPAIAYLFTTLASRTGALRRYR